jgi:serine/threonine protein kinase
VTSQGSVKLADFGLAKDLNSDLKLTADGAMIGTPLYMAPEIGRVKEIDGRVDVYSLGVTYYYLLTGTQPFREFAAMDILSAKAHAKLKPPEVYLPDIPVVVRNVLGKMLAKDRDQRYATCEELARDLEALERGLPVSAGEPALWGPLGGAQPTGKGTSRRVPAVAASEDGGEKPGMSPAVLFLLVFVSVLALSLLVLLVVWLAFK